MICSCHNEPPDIELTHCTCCLELQDLKTHHDENLTAEADCGTLYQEEASLQHSRDAMTVDASSECLHDGEQSEPWVSCAVVSNLEALCDIS